MNVTRVSLGDQTFILHIVSICSYLRKHLLIPLQEIAALLTKADCRETSAAATSHAVISLAL